MKKIMVLAAIAILIVMMAILKMATFAEANDYTHEAYISPDGNEESYHGKETRQNIGESIGRMIGQFADIPKGIAKGFQEVKDGNDGAEYDYYREGGISQAKYRNYSDDPQGALPSSGSPGYPPVNFGRDCTSAIIVPGSNIVLPVPGTTRSGRAFYAPNSGNLQANIGSRGWNVRLGN